MLPSPPSSLRSRALGLAIGCVLGCGGGDLRPTHATASTYLRADTDHLSIVAPSVRGGARWEDATFEAGYSLDAWTGASIDIRTAASPNVDEVRHEVTVGAGHEIDDFTLSARYRGSFEPDYVSHGGSARGVLELDGGMTTLSLDVFGSGDDVGRTGDPWFHRAAGRVGGVLGWTQILDRETLVAVGGEVHGLFGYQASPYRFVAVGGLGTCASLAAYCLPEVVPDERLRATLGARARRALGPHFSIGAGYRFYGDDWGVLAHTAEAEIAMTPASWVVFTFGYRFYVQGEASFYAPRYFDAERELITRDRKLSAFLTHQVGAELTFLVDVDPSTQLFLGARGSGTVYDYLAFVGLSQVVAVELTLTTELRFR